MHLRRPFFFQTKLDQLNTRPPKPIPPFNMENKARFILSQIPDVKRIVEEEAWLEGERRGQAVDRRDPAIRERVADILLSEAGDYLRQKHDVSLRARESVSLPSKGSILLVDDEEGVLEFVGMILTQNGYTVLSARSGIEGWKQFQESSSWDLVILDRAMPEMGGEELARKIKAVSPHTPLVMITGNTEAISEPGLFNEILSKPFLSSNLIRCAVGTLERCSGTS